MQELPYELHLLEGSKGQLNLFSPPYQLLTQFLIQPESENYRFLIKHGTGLGKTKQALQIGKNFLDKGIKIFIFTFNSNIFVQDMIKFPELGYVSEHLSAQYNKAKDEKTNYDTIFSQINREINQKVTFVGYKEFSNQLFYQKDGFTQVKPVIIRQYFNSLVICDEIHDVYSMEYQNTWGSTIQVLSNILQKSIYILYMSATPINNPPEILSLLGLMCINQEKPQQLKEIMDYIQALKFENIQQSQNPLKIDQSREFLTQIHDLIKKHMFSKVSFVPEVSQGMPELIFQGEQFPGINQPPIYRCYLKEYQFPQHIQRLEEHVKYLTFDFPGGVSIEDFIYQLRQRNPQALSWAEKNQIIVKQTQPPILTGDFLIQQNVGKFSPKFWYLIDNLKKVEGKSFIYINKVKISGVQIVEQLLQYNGIIPLNEHPQHNTLCFVCRTKLAQHSQEHEFIPYRFISIFSDQGKNVNQDLLQKYNDSSNYDGKTVQVIIGSKMVKQGVNILHTNNIFVLTLPYNFPNLVQVLGRVVRTGSHKLLPPDKQYVKAFIMVTAKKEKCPAEYQEIIKDVPSISISFEQEKSKDIILPEKRLNSDFSIEEIEYLIKAERYKQVQEIEKIIHQYSIDPQIYGDTFFIKQGDKYTQSTELKMLPFKPYPIFNNTIDKKNYYIYKLYEIVREQINILLTTLFIGTSKKVWKFQDLLETIKKYDSVPNFGLINDKLIELAIYNYPNVVFVGEYVINHQKKIDINWFFKSEKKKKLQQITLKKNNQMVQFDSQILDTIKQLFSDYFNNIQNMQFISKQYKIDTSGGYKIVEQIIEKFKKIQNKTIIEQMQLSIQEQDISFLLPMFLLILPVSLRQVYQQLSIQLTNENADQIIGFIHPNGSVMSVFVYDQWRIVQTQQILHQVTEFSTRIDFNQTKIIRSNQNLGKNKDKRYQFQGVVCNTIVYKDVKKFADLVKVPYDKNVKSKLDLCQSIRQFFIQQDITERIYMTNTRFVIYSLGV